MNSSTSKPPASGTISWILYDFANTTYSMNVVSLYFPTWIVLVLAQSDFWVSLVNSISMALVALSMPVLGDWSDRKNKKLLALFVFTMLCILGTLVIGLVGTTVSNMSLLVPVVLFLYIVSNYSYQGGLVFYNALLPSVSTPKTMGRVSGYGVAIGYMGSAAGLIIGGLFVDGNVFGLTIPGISAGGEVAAFIPTAIVFFTRASPAPQIQLATKRFLQAHLENVGGHQKVSWAVALSCSQIFIRRQYSYDHHLYGRLHQSGYGLFRRKNQSLFYPCHSRCSTWLHDLWDINRSLWPEENTDRRNLCLDSEFNRPHRHHEYNVILDFGCRGWNPARLHLDGGAPPAHYTRSARATWRVFWFVCAFWQGGGDFWPIALELCCSRFCCIRRCYEIQSRHWSFGFGYGSRPDGIVESSGFASATKISINCRVFIFEPNVEM